MKVSYVVVGALVVGAGYMLYKRGGIGRPEPDDGRGGSPAPAAANPVVFDGAQASPGTWVPPPKRADLIGGRKPASEPEPVPEPAVRIPNFSTRFPIRK